MMAWQITDLQFLLLHVAFIGRAVNRGGAATPFLNQQPVCRFHPESLEFRPHRYPTRTDRPNPYPRQSYCAAPSLADRLRR